MSFTPKFTITNAITAGLTKIERARGFLEAAKLSEDWITEIVAGPTNTTTEQNRAVTSFTLTAAFRHADSAYIRTAPLSQTLR